MVARCEARTHWSGLLDVRCEIAANRLWTRSSATAVHSNVVGIKAQSAFRRLGKLHRGRTALRAAVSARSTRKRRQICAGAMIVPSAVCDPVRRWQRGKLSRSRGTWVRTVRHLLPSRLIGTRRAGTRADRCQSRRSRLRA